MISLLNVLNTAYPVTVAVINSYQNKYIAKKTNINKSTLQRMSINICQVEGIQIKENVCGFRPYIIYQDKMVKNLTGSVKLVYLAILITIKF